MADKTLTVNGQPFTFNRDKFAGVRTMTVNGETVTVDRTAPVIDSDRAGASRPLLSNLVGGAAAAYSLRDLNDKAGNNKVVRVRRESDNNERDFLAKEVSNGTLQNWVNTQATLPLDLQTLTSEGRTGSVIGAQAAYSLRNLSKNYTGNVVEVRRNIDGATRNFTATEIADGSTIENWVNTSFTSSLPLDVQGSAAAAYSLRELSSTYSGAVVNVRRSSDDTTRDFTADSITNGDLVTFVNEDVTIYQSDFSAGVNGFTQTSTTTLTGNQDGVSDEAGTTKDNVLKAVKASDDQGYIQRDQGVVAGLTYIVSGTFFAPTSNTSVDGIMIKDGYSGSALSDFPSGYLTSSGVWTDFSFSYTATASGNQRINFGISSLGSNPTSSSTGSTGDIVYISDLKFVETTSNGHVKTWYDQSGNSNHATQGTPDSQPKIVSDGSLNADGVDFDGTDDFLELTSVLGAGANQSIFVVQKSDDLESSSTATIFDNRDSSGQGSSVLIGSGNFKYLVQSASTTAGSSNLNENILTSINNSSNTSAGLNGTLTAGTAGGTIANSGDEPRIGARSYSTAANFYDGSIKEIITYNTDQSENRRAIEESIATNYSITLGSFSRNGMVRTWYDQSGNSNHATQGTDANQPKVVDAGSYLGKVKFDGTDDSFDAVSISSSSFPVSVISLSSPAVTNSTMGIYGIAGQSGGFYKSSNLFSMFAGSRLDSSVSSVAGNDFIRTDIFNGSSSSLSVNGTETTGTIGTTTTSLVKFEVGNSTQSGNNILNGSIKEIILYTSDQSEKRRAIEESIATANSITLASFSRDGLVKTWYDQSGSNFHAIQDTTTLQPKIVENGLLTKNELGNPSIKLAGTGDHLLHTIGDSTKYLSQNQEISLISFSDKLSKTRSPLSLYSSISNGSRYFHISEGADTSNFHARNTVNKSVPASASGNVRLTTGITTSDTDYKVASMGGAFVSSTDDYGNNLTASHRLDQIFIGKFRPTQYDSFHGFITELLFYNSDQTDNRTALEANIAEHYGISGVPTATDTVNGFVEAWYDQSGNGIDAEQTSSTEQPLIVINGTLNANGIKFDGVDDYLDIGGTGSGELGIISETPLSIYTVQQPSYKAVIGDNSNRLIRFNPYTTQFYATVQIVVETWATVLPLNDLAVFSVNHGGTGTTSIVKLRANGENASTSSIRQGTTHANIASSPIEYIGKNQGNASQDRFEKSIKEIIFYKSNQELNAPAIEANLANQYGITLL